jgi:hypothetical protein
MQAADGTLHASYSYSGNRCLREEGKVARAIKHAHFNEEWVIGESIESLGRCPPWLGQ